MFRVSFPIPRVFLSCLGVLLTGAAPSFAAPGVSLRWDHCYSDGGVANKTFACDTNAGSERLVLSFVLGSPMTLVSGMEFRMFFTSADATLPAWWDLKDAGTCRQTALGASFSPPPGTSNCVDWGSGNEAGGIGSYQSFGPPLGPNSRILQGAVAVPLSGLASLAADQEYFAMNLLIGHSKTVGAGACAGCESPMCIVLDRLVIRTNSPGGVDDIALRDPAFGTDSHFARWQNAQETNPQLVCGGLNFGCYHDFGCALSTTPTYRSTWGQVKSLYR